MQINDIVAWIETEIDQAVAEAQTIADSFWFQHHQVRQGEPREQWGRLGVRARKHRGNLAVDWYRMEFRLVQGRWKVFSKYLRRGHQDRYPASAFHVAQIWEREAVAHCEAQFAMLRQRTRLLGTLRQSLRQLAKAYPETDKASVEPLG